LFFLSQILKLNEEGCFLTLINKKKINKVLFFPSVKNQKGSTLIEIMISVAILGMFFSAIMGLVSSSISIVVETRSRTQAAFLAQEAVEIAYNIRETNHNKGALFDANLYTVQGWYKLNSYDPLAGWKLAYSNFNDPNLPQNDGGVGFPNLGSTTFTRYIWIELDGTNKRKIKVTVKWPGGSVTAEEVIANW